MKSIEVVCKQCGKRYCIRPSRYNEKMQDAERYNRPPVFFCSWGCVGESRRVHPLKTCAKCGKQYTDHKTRRDICQKCRPRTAAQRKRRAAEKFMIEKTFEGYEPPRMAREDVALLIPYYADFLAVLMKGWTTPEREMFLRSVA